jgi:hypothetical protein
MIGAEPESCTQHLVLTKDLPRYLGLIGVSGIHGWSRATATNLRRVGAEFPRRG